MSGIKERAAYLRGLLEGMDFVENAREKVLWEGLVNFCGEIADEMQEMEDTQNEFAEYIEAVDEDLSILEKYFYNNNAEEGDSEEVVFTNEYPESGDYEVVCPECGEVVWNHSGDTDAAESHDVL